MKNKGHLFSVRHYSLVVNHYLKSILVFFLICSSSFLHANKTKVDSLTRLLIQTESDTAKARLLNELAYTYRNTSADTSRLYAKRAIELARGNGDSLIMATSYNHFGVIFKNLGNYAASIENHLKALRIREAKQNEFGMVQSYNNLGVAYMYQNMNAKCLDYFKKSYQLLSEMDNKKGLSSVIGNIGIVYYNMLDYDEAERFYLKAVEINKELKNEESLGYTYNNLGVLYDQIELYDKALDYYNKALKIEKKEEDRYGITSAISNIAGIYFMQEKIDSAIYYAEQALSIAREIGSKHDMKQLYWSLSNYYEASDDYEQAVIYFNAYSNMKDSLLGDDRTRQIAEMDVIYKNDKKQHEIALLAQKNQLNQVKLKNDSIVNYAIMAGIGTLIIAVILIIIGAKNKNKANNILKINSIEIANQTKVLEEKNKDIMDSINYAKRLQDSVLPGAASLQEIFPESMLFFAPRDVVSGDFYWIYKQGKRVLFAVADCANQGVPGAMISVVGYNALNKCVREFKLEEPAQILNKLSELVSDFFGTIDIALCSYDSDKLELKYAGVNHPLWVITEEGSSYASYDSSIEGQDSRNVSSNGTMAESRKINVTEYKPDSHPIGEYDSGKSYANHVIQLQKNDLIYIFTDGFYAQFGGSKGKKLSIKGFKDLLFDVSDKPMKDQHKELSSYLKGWKQGHLQVDDICVLGIRV